MFHDGTIAPTTVLGRTKRFFFFHMIANTFSIIFVIIAISCLRTGDLLVGVTSGIIIIMLGCLFDGLLVFGGG